MLHVFHGNDTIAVRQAALAVVREYEEKGMTVARLEGEAFEPGVLQDAVGATSLFGETTLYLIDSPSVDPDCKDDVLRHLPALAESANVFVVIEETLLAADKKAYTKHAATIAEAKATPGETFNPFGMAEALAQKDKKSLWILLQDARQAGLAAEAIIGTLWWQLKTLRLAALTGSAREAGLKDFPYNKAKRALLKFKPDEVQALATSLLTLYHQGHAGECDLDLALEAWVLRI